MEPAYVDLARLSVKGRERWSEFQDNARVRMSEFFGAPLNARMTNFPKNFDMVSPLYDIIGDAKWKVLPPKGPQRKVLFEEITTYVWLLEKTTASRRFIIFGNDRRVPELWLGKYGPLTTPVEFYFWDENDPVERLNFAPGPSAIMSQV